MGIASDLKVLYHLAVKPVRGENHAERLESFYGGQAEAYDDFRKRLLQGRQEMYASLDLPEGGVWVDMGGGTGSNLEYRGDDIPKMKSVYVVDLASSLLKVCDERIQARGWETSAKTVEADATKFTPEEGLADVVTFSYSLTMIPDWFAAMDNALRILKPGGLIGVVDFYVSRKYPHEGRTQHGWFNRNFWPVWFSSDNVHPSADHLPYLQRQFETVTLEERRAKVPYLPLVRTPYYYFVGRKPAA
ncbi:class I SAM-dependent methyltransferase [Blastopirellula marina]|uniref:Probable ubiquinone/menaquinone biosynthesis methyltransferase n=1 Tax=Blastopirellula marina DSM 3645 TaxID=314230 RepID=A3ZLE8_9BACT|nr:class I SAM-dependent methyltransferase [Blastopirellula marina]EAQ82581.1 probable ubiquinone/menaquinone biosynthesis methyltransferase [Blastopirellula marina DSM 3645]